MPNPASEALHKNFGFGPAGLFRNSGNKFGRWHDVAWFEKQINVYDSRPQPPVSLSDLGKDVVEDALARSALVLKPTVRA